MLQNVFWCPNIFKTQHLLQMVRLQAHFLATKLCKFQEYTGPRSLQNVAVISTGIHISRNKNMPEPQSATPAKCRVQQRRSFNHQPAHAREKRGGKPARFNQAYGFVRRCLSKNVHKVKEHSEEAVCRICWSLKYQAYESRACSNYILLTSFLQYMYVCIIKLQKPSTQYVF